MISIQEQIKCIDREIALRVHVYAQRVRDGKMSEEFARKQIDTMRAVLESLKGIEDPQREMFHMEQKPKTHNPPL